MADAEKEEEEQYIEPAEPIEGRPFVGFQPPEGERPTRWYPELRPEGLYEVEQYNEGEYRARPAEPVAQTLGEVATPEVLNKVFWFEKEQPWHPGSRMGGGYTNEDIMNDAWRPSDRPTVRLVQESGVLNLTRPQIEALRASPYPPSVDPNDPEAVWRYKFWSEGGRHRLPDARDLEERYWMAYFPQRYGRPLTPNDIRAYRRQSPPRGPGFVDRYGPWGFSPDTPRDWIQHLIIQKFGGELPMPEEPRMAPPYPGLQNYTRVTPAAGPVQGAAAGPVQRAAAGPVEEPQAHELEAISQWTVPRAETQPAQYPPGLEPGAPPGFVPTAQPPQVPLSPYTPGLEQGAPTGFVPPAQPSVAQPSAARRTVATEKPRTLGPRPIEPVAQTTGVSPFAAGRWQGWGPRSLEPNPLVGIRPGTAALPPPGREGTRPTATPPTGGIPDWWTILASVRALGPDSPWYRTYLQRIGAIPTMRLGIRPGGEIGW